MKALKISLLLAAVVVLTVSVISKDSIVKNDTNTYENSNTTYNPIAHVKKKRGVVSNG